MTVNSVVLKRTFELHKEEYEQAALRALNSGWYILGKEMETFEKQLAEHLGVKHCVALNSGTDALILAVRSLGIKEGDEVIVPANAYIASVIGITENGATPVFVDADEYMEIDVDKIEEKITEKTKAILPVHLYGQCSCMDKIKEIADKYGLYVIEDCAQCLGSKYDGKYAGTFGAIGCLSFYPTKPLGAFGDAGAIITNDDEVAERVRLLRNYGSKVKYHNEINGVNSRMDEVQAAMLQVGLKYLDEMTKERQKQARLYTYKITNKKVHIPAIHEKVDHVYHLFPVLVEDRENFQNYLKDNGVNTQVHYPIPPYVAECYKDWGYKWNDFPNAGKYANQEVSLPIYAGMPDEEIQYVIDVINAY
ncbi:MAG: DegT/DnrJ/EryC1/StrS family aminotransferase [Lachnospiraceae bacterium]|nr:DegT/DnrJ/EryC1/StrS family aminotransferase [Lachnospiraceae bacterium]